MIIATHLLLLSIIILRLHMRDVCASRTPYIMDITRLEQMDQLLDYIRANLRNIRNTWGESSAQYRSAAEIMERALIDNATRMRLDEWRLKELMDKMDKLTVEP